MKKLLLFFALVISFGCSSEDEECEPQTEALEAIHEMYRKILNHPEATDQQIIEAQAEYDEEVAFYEEDPCTYMERRWPEEYD